MGPIVLLTDFAQRDGYAGVMKGVIKHLSPQVEILDLTHDIPPQDVAAARFTLWQSYAYFPVGTIFVVVVDPGVGTQRRILCVKSREYIFLAPENGVLDYILAELPVETIISVENPEIMRQEVSATFHGRDIFAPTAAHLSRGMPLSLVGPLASYQVPTSPFVDIKDEGVYAGQVLHIDHFGNLISNIRLHLQPQFAQVAFDNLPEIAFQPTYGKVAPGEALGLVGSHGLLEIAVNQGNAAQLLDKERGDEFVFRFQSLP